MNHWLLRYRLQILILFIGITLLSLFFITRLEVNPNLDRYVPDNIDNQIYTKQLDSIFGGSEMLLLMLEADDVVKPSTLKRLRLIADGLGDLEGIDRCISPFDAQDISIDDGFIQMEPFLDGIPEDPAACQLLKSKIIANGMASRFFYVDDFSLVSLIMIKNSQWSDKLLINKINSVLANNPGPEKVMMGGLPYIRYSISENIKKDMIVLLPVALLLMVIMLYASFREWKGVLMPFIVVIMSMILSFGVMALLGWQISLITILLPIMLIAIANDYGIHMIARYQELAQGEESLSMMQICRQIYKDLKRPIVITGLTTIGGILGLLTHTMIPAAQLGVLAAIGIGFALLLSIWFLPAMLSYFKPVLESKKSGKRKIVSADHWLKNFSRLVTTHPKQVILVSVLVGVLGIGGIFFIRVDTNLEGYFLGKSEVSRAIDLVNEKLGGSQYISILFTGDILSPEVLNRMDAYEQALSEDPAVGTVSSPVTLVKELSKGFYYPHEAGYEQIPSTANEAYQFIEVFSMGGNEEAVEQFIDYNYENSRLLVTLNDGSNKEGKRLLKKIEDLTKDDPDVKFIAGSCLTKIALADMVVKGQVKSLILAMVVVFVLLSIIFRSGRAGFLSALPLSVAILVLFGLMGFFGIALDIATALLSSIMIGVGIDYTIHFLWRFKEERARGIEHKEAAYITLTTTGRGIVFNAISVIIGFLALTLSNFAPLRFFGALVVISISTCLISALILIPSIVILAKPKFLEKKN
jgi:hydrophobe/amphiphile efflux-3 (HAE3) family protein